MKQHVIDKLSAHRDAIRRYGVLSLSLFGSVARGEERPDSDVDLLVEFERPPTFDAYMDLKFFLEDLVGRSVDLVSTRALKPLARPFVEREAIRVTWRDEPFPRRAQRLGGASVQATRDTQSR